MLRRSVLAVPLVLLAAAASARASGTPVVVAPPAEGHIAWLVDSDDAGPGGTTSLVIADGDGHDRRTLVHDAGSANSVSISPQGKRVAYVSASGDRVSLDVVGASGGRVTSLVTLRGDAQFDGATWSANGRALVYSSNAGSGPGGYFALFRVSSGGGRPVRITPYLDAVAPTLGLRGAIVYAEESVQTMTGASGVWSVGPGGGRATRLFHEPFPVLLPRVSPDGRQIAFTRSFGAGLLSSTVDVTSITGRDLRALTPQRAGLVSADPSWSPDGGRLAFLSNRSGRFQDRRSNPLLDAFTMTPRGTTVAPVVLYAGSRRIGIDDVTWGP